MAKKEENWKTSLKDIIKSRVLFKIKEYIQSAVIVTQKKIMRTLISSLLLLVGITFLVLGSTFYLTDVLKYSRSFIYLIMGFILVLISIIFAQTTKLLKYDLKK